MDRCQTAYIGLGGNVGDVLSSMRSALTALDQVSGLTLVKASPVYKTPPWGVEDQNWFLNCCAEISSMLSAQELLQACLDTEISLKRERNLRWGPRTIDLDVLIFGDEEIEIENLTVPHPRMHERLFVMQPLSDIAPDVQLRGRTIVKWVGELNEEPLQMLELKERWWL